MTSELTRRLERLKIELRRKKVMGYLLVYEYSPGVFHLPDQKPDSPGMTEAELDELAENYQELILVSYIDMQMQPEELSYDY